MSNFSDMAVLPAAGAYNTKWRAGCIKATSIYEINFKVHRKLESSLNGICLESRVWFIDCLNELDSFQVDWIFQQKLDISYKKISILAHNCFWSVFVLQLRIKGLSLWGYIVGVITAGYVEWLYANCVIKQKQLHPCVYMLTYY